MPKMDRQSIPRIATKVLMPYIMLFGLYVQFHGDFGPGGGFQAGVIFASAFVLHALTFGPMATRKVIPPWVVQTLVPMGVLLYGGVGMACLLLGHNFLDYNALNSHDAAHGQHYGILLVELGVGITVCGVMLAIFDAFVTRGRSE